MIAEATAAYVSEEDSVPWECVALLLAKAGESSKEVESQEELVEDNNIVHSWWREDRSLMLQFVMPSAVKKAHVKVAHGGPVVG